MSERVDQKIAITVDVEDIEAVLEFTRLNLDLISEEEFRHIHKSALAVQEAVRSGRRTAWDEHNAKERTTN